MYLRRRHLCFKNVRICMEMLPRMETVCFGIKLPVSHKLMMPTKITPLHWIMNTGQCDMSGLWQISRLSFDVRVSQSSDSTSVWDYMRCLLSPDLSVCQQLWWNNWPTGRSKIKVFYNKTRVECCCSGCFLCLFFVVDSKGGDEFEMRLLHLKKKKKLTLLKVEK